MLIDWNRVSELRSEIGGNDFSDVVALFIEEVEDMLDQFNSATEANDLQAQLHYLKGSALNLGFHAFANACRSAESKVAIEGPAAIDKKEILEGFQQSKSEFLKSVEI
ncbi:Hpt domain-containing protein [Roseovarius sp. SYSU LYC5161]|uniref:Hpt domain-containing protein n=1 Tax=Roseovarius halophilus (ex Wu et al. 2025) TaxID=3376060 RepID=UPI00399B5A2B